MDSQNKNVAGYSVQLPSDLEYIPPLRQFIAEVARVEGFSKKFCFRTEIIVDELVTNGILHGSQDVHTAITVSAKFEADDAVGIVALGCQHDDRRRRCATQLTAKDRDHSYPATSDRERQG